MRLQDECGRIRCRMKILRFLLGLAALACQARAQFFPLETKSILQREDLCHSQPPQLDDGPYEYTVYSRKPFTWTDALSMDTSERLTRQELQASTAHHKVLRRVYDHPLIMTANELSRGLVNPGEEARMQRFLAKLISGEPVTVVTLGGSISFGHGVPSVEESWPGRMYDWIHKTFPNSEHRLLNAAIPATTSSFVEPCIYTLLPSGIIDLVFMEYTINDSAEDLRRNPDARMDTPARRAMERLVRELVDLPSKPALVGLHAWSPHATYLKTLTGQPKPFGGSEDMLTQIFTHYGATIFSFRNAMVPILRLQPSLRDKIWPPKDVHPNCIGTRYMADMMIGFFMDKLAHAAWTEHVRKIQQLGISSEIWQLDEETDLPLPQPLFSGNNGTFTTQCIMDSSLANHVAGSSGFTWENGGTPRAPKWRYVSTTPHSHLMFKVPLDNINFDRRTRRIVLGIGIVLSWAKDMGVGTLACQGGCVCESKDFSTYLAYAGWSMTFWEFVSAQVTRGSSECILVLLNAKETYSEGHKLLVSHLLVSGNMQTLEARVRWQEDGVISSVSKRRQIGH